MRSWALRAASSGYTARWWPSPSATGCPPTTYDVHFEKAYGELQGAYAMINREFARWVRARHPEIRYLNREDDMGVEGLRKAKQSYYPDLMVEKHTAVMK